MIFFFCLLSVLFLLSTTVLILSIFHMISSDNFNNIFIGVLGGVYSTSYMVVFIVFCYKNKKPKPKPVVEVDGAVDGAVEGDVEGVVEVEVINQQIEGC